MKPMRLDLPYLSDEPDRHGNPRLYVRRYGRRVRILAKVGSQAFTEAYSAALVTLRSRVPATIPTLAPAARGTLAWLGARYFASAEFQGLDPQSQATRRGVIEECFRERHSDEDPEPMGHCPLPHVSAAKIKRLRDLKKGLPGAANNRKKYLSAMFTWAMEEAQPPLMKSNPCRDVKRVRYATSGFHNWTVGEVEQFRIRHPIGSKGRLALEMVLFSGVRRSDLVTLGRQHVRDGWIRFIPRKTRHKRARLSEKPLLPDLARILSESPCGDLTFLVTAYGRPFTAKGFGGWFRERCDEAKLYHCSVHGLRKAGATLAAESGATVHQLMAIFDWETPGQAKIYTDAADRKRLAGEAMPLLARGTK